MKISQPRLRLAVLSIALAATAGATLIVIGRDADDEREPPTAPPARAPVPAAVMTPAPQAVAKPQPVASAPPATGSATGSATTGSAAPVTADVEPIHAACGERFGRPVTAGTKVVADATGAAQMIDKVEKAGFGDPGTGCGEAEYWLITGDPANPTRRQLLGHGFSGQCGSVGDDAALSETGDAFTFTDWVGGGHPEHYSHSMAVRLSPLELGCEHDSDAERFPDTNVVDTDWDWTTFRGTGNATYFRCDGSGQALSSDNADTHGPQVGWVTVPMLPDSAAGATQLGGCAARVDTPGASFRAVIAGRELLVDIADAHVTGEDHVVLWLAHEASPRRLDRCEDFDAPGAVAWNIRAIDGVVSAGPGHAAETLHVNRHTEQPGGRIMLAIALPEWFDANSGITVVYNDSSGDGRPARQLATSELQAGKRWTLGRARDRSARGQLYGARRLAGAGLEPHVQPRRRRDPVAAGLTATALPSRRPHGRAHVPAAGPRRVRAREAAGAGYPAAAAPVGLGHVAGRGQDHDVDERGRRPGRRAAGPPRDPGDAVVR